jgi:hypothetical protein
MTILRHTERASGLDLRASLQLIDGRERCNHHARDRERPRQRDHGNAAHRKPGVLHSTRPVLLVGHHYLALPRGALLASNGREPPPYAARGRVYPGSCKGVRLPRLPAPESRATRTAAALPHAPYTNTSASSTTIVAKNMNSARRRAPRHARSGPIPPAHRAHVLR